MVAASRNGIAIGWLSSSKSGMTSQDAIRTRKMITVWLLGLDPLAVIELRKGADHGGSP